MGHPQSWGGGPASWRMPLEWVGCVQIYPDICANMYITQHTSYIYIIYIYTYIYILYTHIYIYYIYYVCICIYLVKLYIHMYYI